MPIHKEALADIKKLREVSEKNAQKKLAEAAAPRIKEFLDKKFAELTEQQLNAMGPEGFPYEGEPMKAAPGIAPPGVSQPVVAAGPFDLSPSSTSVQVDSIAVPQMGSAIAQGTGVPGDTGSAGVGVLLDLDAVASEVDRLLNEPQVPVQEEPLGSDLKPLELNVTIEKSNEDGYSNSTKDQETQGTMESELLGGDEDEEEILLDDDLVKMASKSGTEEKKSSDLENNEKKSLEDDENEDDNVIYIEPGLTKESASLSFEDVYTQLSNIEEVVSSFESYLEPSKLVRSANAIQETVRDTKTLKKAIQDGLANKDLTSEQFIALYEVVSQVENSLKSKVKEIENVQFAVKSADELKTIKEFESKIVLKISDMLDDFGGGHVIEKHMIEDSGVVGPMKQDEVVYEIDLRGEDTDNQEAILEINAQSNLEEKKMAKHRDEVIEISDAELRRALRQARLKEGAAGTDLHHKADGGTQEDPFLASLGHADATDILDLDGVFDEVEAEDLASTSTVSRKEKMPEGVHEAMKKLRRQVSLISDEKRELQEKLEEARLTNAKLIHANKLIQDKGLSLEAKRRVAKAIDKAESVREVKLVFNTIMEQIGSATANLKEGRVRAGASSRVTKSGSAQGESASGQLAENTDMARMRRLAGMKK